MTCPDCNKPIATEADYEAIPEGEGAHLCWSSYGDRCGEAPVDWRRRAQAVESANRHLESGIAQLAAIFGIDPSQPTDADLVSIEHGIEMQRVALAEAGKTIREQEATILALQHRAASDRKLIDGQWHELHVMRSGETSASISKWQNETFGPATTVMDRVIRSWDAMDRAWAEVRDCNLRIPRPNLSRAIRAAEEMAEMISTLVVDDRDPKACVEVADVQIVLAGIPAWHGQDQAGLVNAKMAVNRSRSWALTGDGHGQHVESKP